MLFREIGSFDVVRGQRAWPWIAFSARGDLVAFPSNATTIATRRIEDEAVVPGPSFTVPAEIAIGTFSISSDREAPRVVVAGLAGTTPLIAVFDGSTGQTRMTVEALLGAGHEVRAVAFERTGQRFWISAETETETVIALVDATSLSTVGVVRSPALPRPALHELHVHPVDDAILLLAACGEEGTFARVVGFARDEVSAVPGELDAGGIAAGFVGFSLDAARVHLVEADELRTHAWPTLHELSSVPLADDFVSSFSGAVLGQEILVDGEDAETQEDQVMLFDPSAIRGIGLPPVAPPDMWAGTLGDKAIVTLESKGDPVRARVLLRTAAGARSLLH